MAHSRTLRDAVALADELLAITTPEIWLHGEDWTDNPTDGALEMSSRMGEFTQAKVRSILMEKKRRNR